MTFKVVRKREHSIGTNYGRPALRIGDPHHVPHNKRRGEVSSTLIATLTFYDGSSQNPDPWLDITLEETTKVTTRPSRRTVGITLNADEVAALRKMLDLGSS